jgi:formamidopyrimidine-DNA glycosylase|tara:strand:- start:5536 stop:5973 length:438 start_codon:yes stop_codon:yes gene_type:complete
VPELPEVTAYIRALEPRILGKVLEIVRIRTPSLLRTFDPRVSELGSRHLTEVRRVGKRIVFELDGEFFAVIHLMISGRLHWTEKGTPIPKKRGHTAFDFNSGTLLLTKGERPRGNRAHQTKKDAERLIGPPASLPRTKRGSDYMP